MEAFAFYLIKSSVWLSAFALVYALFLRNERFFTLNRIFLVSGLVISVIFPLFTWHYTVVLPVIPTIQVDEPQMQRIVVAEESFPIQTILMFLYLTGITFLILKILRQTIPVFRIIKRSEAYQMNSVKLIRTAEYPASFSFISFVFVNPSTDEIETREIVNHEQEHIRQKHWIDLLLFEILCTIQWFNPVIWLYGRLIRQNHEYLADERALQRSSNPAVYRAALLNQMFGGPVISLANSFNYSLNKKRFNMMKHTIKSPFRKLKLLLVLPMIAAVFYAFSAPEYQFTQAKNNNILREGKTVTGKVTDEKDEALPGASVIVSGKTIGTQTDLNGTFKLELTDDSPIVISFVGFTSQKVTPDSEKEMVIKLKTQVIGIEAMGNDILATKTQSSAEPGLIIIDGKESSKAVMSSINPDKIEKVAVLKDQMAVEKYGEKGKKGVIEITLKNDYNGLNDKSFKIQTEEPLIISGTSGPNQPLIVVDGKITDNIDTNNISPETIDHIDVLKNESSTKMYGDKGKNGVVLIYTKKDNPGAKNETIELKVTGYVDDQSNDLPAQPNSGIKIRSNGESNNPLVVIDGIISKDQNIEKIDPETIESMSVLKDEKATAKYGTKGKNGVIEITSKPDKGAIVIVEEMPQFPGGIEALKEFVASTMKYPAIALENRIQGQVTVNFVVRSDGSVTDAKIGSGLDPALDKEALRIVNQMPKWKPGSQSGKNVKVSYAMPIKFTLPKDYNDHPVSKEKLH